MSTTAEVHPLLTYMRTEVMLRALRRTYRLRAARRRTKKRKQAGR